jgi:two-component system, OmpR family, response regulator CpxR
VVHILVIDDDIELCNLVTEYLEPEGFKVEAVHDGKAGLERALSGEHALAVLDVMLPGLAGFEVLKQVRTQSRLPILMLTARGEDVDRIVGLEIGADDYMPKPFNPRELAARIRAILRRVSPESTETERDADRVSVGDIEMDLGTRSVRRDGSPVDLTVIEFDVLERLLKTPGKIVTRQALVKEVLGRTPSPLDRSIDMHISNLRKKLGHTTPNGERIKTVRGVGFIYVRPESGENSEQPNA